MHNLLLLHQDLQNKTYTHSSYHHFKISDPKPRDIHKASVRDRLVHHAIYRRFYPFFNTRFIADVYSCRVSKGIHLAMKRFRDFAHKESHNHTRTVWVLKCDIRKFFASIDQQILLKIIGRYVSDEDILRLVEEVIGSFHRTQTGVGLPLGNLTSQLFANVYMNEFDQFVKHKLKAKYYIRYADDFVILSRDREWLESLLHCISDFLRDELRLALHPNKVSIETIASGVDFLGWVHFRDHRVLRTSTKHRMLKRVQGLEEDSPTVQSYLGMLKHGNTEKLRHDVGEQIKVFLCYQGI
ncbi:MAG: reverse transcriptase/maturase family protein [bacterium]